jgi:hypothetical protein
LKPFGNDTPLASPALSSLRPGVTHTWGRLRVTRALAALFAAGGGNTTASLRDVRGVEGAAAAAEAASRATVALLAVLEFRGSPFAALWGGLFAEARLLVCEAAHALPESPRERKPWEE